MCTQIDAPALCAASRTLRLHFLWHRNLFGIFKSGLDGTDLDIWLQLNLVLWTLWANTLKYKFKCVPCSAANSSIYMPNQRSGSRQRSSIETPCSAGIVAIFVITYTSLGCATHNLCSVQTCTRQSHMRATCACINCPLHCNWMFSCDFMWKPEQHANTLKLKSMISTTTPPPSNFRAYYNM